MGSRWQRRLGRRRAAVIAIAVALVAALVGCSSGKQSSSSGGSASDNEVEKTSLVLASTTSTQDSGLFDVLIPAFEKAYPQYTVKIIAVGTGEAIKLGQTKDADVLLVHAKAQEEAFVTNGYGGSRYDVMYNDFVIVGPASDPAGIKSAATVADAMKAIAAAGKADKTVFVSRADASGTNTKELGLWKSAAVVPTSGDWYVQTGQGMGETLKITDEKQGYTLTDRATYLAMQKSLQAVVLFEKQKDLLNQYGVLPVTGAQNYQGALDFAKWITSPAGQKVIGEYGAEKYGQQLFTPNATGTAGE